MNNNAEMFALGPLYSHHRDLVSEMLIKRTVYSEVWIGDEQFKYDPTTKSGFFRYCHEIVEMLFSNYITPNKMDKRAFSKLNRDIAKQLQFY